MGAAMKKIALIMDSWKRYFVYAWPAGIMQRMRETNEDVNLYIFNSSGSWSKDEAYNWGEYNIYRLPKLEEFDGIILDLNNISQSEVLEEVVERARKAEVPVLSISREVEGFYYVGVDNYSAIKKMIAHLHQCHGCRRFWFVMGPEDNYEDQRREAALRDYMKEQGLPFSEQDFYFESYEYSCGVNGFQHLFSVHGELPEAVICANDNIALGVCEAASSCGYSVPEDFLVTGFDNFDKARNFKPRISTVSYVREEVGWLCGDVLLRLWAGEQVPRCNYTEVEHIFWESCGCCQEAIRDDRQYMKERLLYEIETNDFDAGVLALSQQLMHCSTVEQMMDCIPKAIPSMRCDATYLVLDEHMDFFKEQTEVRPPELWQSENFRKVGYPEKMRVRFAYENGQNAGQQGEVLEDIFPKFEKGSGGDYLFLPLHFDEQAVGYFVIQNGVYLMEKQYLFQVVNALNTALENLHRNEKLEYMNRVLSRMYLMDSMTGLYNRRGYQQLFENFLARIHQAGERALIMFLDLDRLKLINDTLGHEYGDYAIVVVGDVLRSHCDKDCMAARIGGDEFLLVKRLDSEEEARRLKENILCQMDHQAEDVRFPMELTVSMGIVVSDPLSGKCLEDYRKEADRMMYKEKGRKHAKRD